MPLRLYIENENIFTKVTLFQRCTNILYKIHKHACMASAQNVLKYAILEQLEKKTERN